MRFVIQRVSSASVDVGGKTTGKIEGGFLVLAGFCERDSTAIADKMVDKMLKLRIFKDENGKTNISLKDVGGSLLIVSQFTLYADCRKGNRPSFTDAAGGESANALYEYVIAKCRERGFRTESGVFGADMSVSLVNDGPFTVVLDSDQIVSRQLK